MKKKKRYIIIFIVLLIYVLLMFFLVGRNNLKEGKYSATILVGDSTIWNYSNKKWLNITSDTAIDSLNWQEFSVYFDNKKYGNYYLWHDDKWYLFDENRKAITNTEGRFLAYRSNYKIGISEFLETPITNYSYVDLALGEIKEREFTTSIKISFDIDSDGKDEDFYIVSNAFPIDFVPENIFSIVFMEKDNNIKMIYKNIAKNTTNNGCKPYINSFIDIDNDKTYELIVSCGRYSVEQPIDILYKLEEDNFKVLISNQ